MPPRPIIKCATSETSTRQTHDAQDLDLREATTIPLDYGVGTRSPTCTLVELGTASGLVLPQPKPGPQFTILPDPNWPVTLLP